MDADTWMGVIIRIWVLGTGRNDRRVVFRQGIDVQR